MSAPNFTLCDDAEMEKSSRHSRIIAWWRKKLSLPYWKLGKLYVAVVPTKRAGEKSNFL